MQSWSHNCIASLQRLGLFSITCTCKCAEVNLEKLFPQRAHKLLSLPSHFRTHILANSGHC